MGTEPTPVPDGYRVELSSAAGPAFGEPALAGPAPAEPAPAEPAPAEPALAEPAVVGAAAGRTGPRDAAVESGVLAGGSLDAAVIAPNTAAYLVSG